MEKFLLKLKVVSLSGKIVQHIPFIHSTGICIKICSFNKQYNRKNSAENTPEDDKTGKRSFPQIVNVNYPLKVSLVRSAKVRRTISKVRSVKARVSKRKCSCERLHQKRCPVFCSYTWFLVKSCYAKYCETFLNAERCGWIFVIVFCKDEWQWSAF